MPATRWNPEPSAEAFLAELTDAAYRVALKHGFKSNFIDVQLDLWSALDQVIRKELSLQDRPRSPVPAGVSTY